MVGLTPKLYKLHRNATQRWHLLRTMITQLVQHERISTTYHKCRALQPLALKVVRLGRAAAKKESNAYNKLLGILTTKLAAKKLTQQIIPRLKTQGPQTIRVVPMTQHRKGDSARMGYIEFIGNEIEKYEKAAEQEKLEKGEIPNIKAFNLKILQEEREFFQKKYDQVKQTTNLEQLQLEEKLQAGTITNKQFEAKQRINQASILFFQRKIEIVDRDIWILNKNKYDIQKYFPVH